MHAFRERFFLLEAVSFCVWGLVLSIPWGLMFPEKGLSALENLGWGLLVGPATALLFWFLWSPVARFLWSLGGGARLVFGLLSFGGLPFVLLIVDTNTSVVLSRLYRGTKPIPYAFPSLRDGA